MHRRHSRIAACPAGAHSVPFTRGHPHPEKGIGIVNIKARFCSHCGSPFGSRSPDGSRSLDARDSGTGPCATCGTAPRLQGPSLLVLVAIFAADRILLQRRGIAPYIGKWAPPGGYVECNESLEAVAV